MRQTCHEGLAVDSWPLTIGASANRQLSTANFRDIPRLRMPSVRDKTIIVTGASSGIGRASAVELARRGANLVIAARRAELLEQVAGQCRALGVTCTPVVADVTNRDDCAKLIAAAPRIDILVNNAGFAVFDAIETAKPDDLQSMMQTNYFGAMWCVQAVLPQMLARGE